MSLLSEFRRRKVFRVAVVYAATAFAVLQGADILLPNLGVPDWTMRFLTVLLVAVGIGLSAQAGDREMANRIAAGIDGRPGGPMLLMGAIYFCRCGAPFDLEVTPMLAKRLEEAGIAWPPISPVDWPLKEW